MAAKVKAILARLDWRRIFAKIFHYLPRVAIYSVCLVLFVANVGQLIANYLRFETIVMVHYEEETSVDFPAFTICGCCLQRPIIDQSPTILLNNELEILKSYPVREVFENQTYKYNNLVSKCYYVHDSKNPDHKIECHVLQSVVESIHDGRKCFTFLSHLVNNPNSGMLDFLQTNEKKRRIISYIQIELNLKGYKLVDKEYPIRNELLNADVIMSMHPNKQIPNMLDAEFFQIEPRKLYEVRFIKEKTILLPKTFNSDCRYYDKRSKPRSQDECVNLCVLRQSFRRVCINYFAIITKEMYQDLESYFNSSIEGKKPVRFCNARSHMHYIRFVYARRICYDECPQDCVTEIYETQLDRSVINSKYLNKSQTKCNKDKSMLVIWPNREMYQTVQHENELGFVQLVGFLGGHAHIWLGLSVVQFYDVIGHVLAYFRYWFEKARSGRRIVPSSQ